MMAFSPDYLLAQLRREHSARGICAAFSGGLDSCALLDALAACRPALGVPVRAIHVNHGLSPHADEWAQFCRSRCEHYQIPCEVLRVDARHPTGHSPEDWARRKRYAALAERLMDGESLVTAHHQDDQAETLLLQLFRGAGPKGLAAMPRRAPFARGWLVRPLLDVRRAELTDYALARGLAWVDDDSNADPRFDRNYLRQHVLPLIEQRWTGVTERLARAAEWQAEAVEILDTTGRLDVQAVAAAIEHRCGMLGCGGGMPLSVPALLTFDSVRRRNALRVWIKEAGLPMPTARHVWHIEHDVLRAAVDAEPIVCWPGAEVRRYRDRIFVMQPAPEWNPATVLSWDLRQPVALPTGCTLRAQRTAGAGIAVDACAQSGVSVRFRRGGERCKPVGRAHTYTLKHLYQAAGVPPWIRDRTPLIYIGERLAAVPGFCVCEPFGTTDLGWVVTCDPGGAAVGSIR